MSTPELPDSPSERESNWKEDWPAKLLLVLMIGWLMYTSVPSLLIAANRGPFMGCRSNLTNLSNAIDEYAKDHQQHYPENLGQLSPKYLSGLPHCPRASQQDYRYQIVKNNGTQNFELSCPGQHRYWGPFDVFSNMRDGYPQYRSEQGLIN